MVDGGPLTERSPPLRFLLLGVDDADPKVDLSIFIDHRFYDGSDIGGNVNQSPAFADGG